MWLRMKTPPSASDYQDDMRRRIAAARPPWLGALPDEFRQSKKLSPKQQQATPAEHAASSGGMFRSSSSNNFYSHTDVTDARRCVQNTARTSHGQTYKSSRYGHKRMSTDITNIRHAKQNTERARQRHWSDTPASTVIQHDVVVPDGRKRRESAACRVLPG